MPTSTTIVCPCILRDLLEELIGPKEYHELRTPSIAQTILLLDSEEKYCHIEWPSKDNPIPAPRLYYIKEWLICYERQQRLKEESERDRKIHGERSESITYIREQLVTMFQFNLKNKVHIERLNKLVDKAVRSKAAGLSEFLGIDLASITESPYGKIRRIK